MTEQEIVELLRTPMRNNSCAIVYLDPDKKLHLWIVGASRRLGDTNETIQSHFAKWKAGCRLLGFRFSGDRKSWFADARDP